LHRSGWLLQFHGNACILHPLIVGKRADPLRIETGRRIAEAQIDMSRTRRARLILFADPRAQITATPHQQEGPSAPIEDFRHAAAMISPRKNAIRAFDEPSR
jgi:hypothetical protein